MADLLAVKESGLQDVVGTHENDHPVADRPTGLAPQPELAGQVVGADFGGRCAALGEIVGFTDCVARSESCVTQFGKPALGTCE